MRKFLSAAVVVGLALACDVNRDLPLSPDGSDHAIFVTVSDPNAAKGAIVTVTGQVATGSSIPTLGSYTARLELGSGLEFLEALSVGAAAQAIRASGDTVIAAGASVSGFADGRLFAVRARVREAGFAPALHIQLVEATATGFVGAPRANRASSISVGKWGDVTIDGRVGAADAQAILTAVVDIALPSGYLKANGDANCDGSVAATDAQVVLSYAVGLSVSQYCVAQPMAQSLTVSTYSGNVSNPIAVLSDASKVKVATWTSTGASGGAFSQTAFIDDGRGLEFRVTYGASDIPTRVYNVKTKESITITTRDDRVDYFFFDGTGAFTAGVALVVQGNKLSLAKVNSVPSFSGQVSALSNALSFSAVAKTDAGLGTLVDAQAGLVAYHNSTLTSSTGTATSAFKRRLAVEGLLAVAAADPTTVGATAAALPSGLIAGGVFAIAAAHYPNYHAVSPDAFETALAKYMQDGIAAKLSPGDVLASAILDLKNNSKLEPADYGKTSSKSGSSSDVLPALADATTFVATTGAPGAATTTVDGFAVDNSDNMYTLTGTVGATGALAMTGSSSGPGMAGAGKGGAAAAGGTLTISGTISGTSFSGTYSGTPGSGSLSGSTSSLGTCQTQTSSGGQGTFAQTFNMGAASGNVTFTYEAYSIPDAFRVVNGGNTILNTGSISGGGSKSFALTNAIVFVTVSAPLSGTAWDFSLSCPKAASTSKIIAVNAGNNQSAAPGAAVAIAPAVKVTDGDGLALSGETVTFAVASGGGTITGASAVTNSSGIATVGSWTLGPTAGTNTLTATLAGATGSPVTFTANGSAGLNLSIDGMYLTQATQSYTGGVPIVANRAGLLRVFVKASESNTATPSVKVTTFQNGTAFKTYTISAPGASVPTTIDEPTLSSSWNVQIPANEIVSGMSILAEVDPSNAVTESSETDNKFPSSGTAQTLDVRTVKTMKITFIPVTQGGGTGDISSANLSAYLDFAKRVYPWADVDAVIASPITYATTLNGASYDAGWTTLLSEITNKHNADGTAAADRYYYAVVKPSYSSGGTGYGSIGAPNAIGVDVKFNGSVGPSTNYYSMTVAHELGHNFGRNHVNCGGPSNPDGSYPYTATTSIGVTGWDPAYNLLRGKDSHTDFMSYCNPLWISDYTYKAVMTWREGHFGPPGSIGEGKSLLVWGRIGPSGIVLEPAFEVDLPVSLPERAGRYSIAAVDASGRSIYNVSFEGTEVDHANGDRIFSFRLPIPANTEVAELRLLDGAQAVARRSRAALGAANNTQALASVRMRTLAGGRPRLEWDSQSFPMAMVKDPVTGEVLSFVRGGAGDVATQRPEVDVYFSNGVTSVRQRVRINR